MATGIVSDRMNAFKLELLDYTESINYLKERLDNCKTTVSNSMNGTGKAEIINKINVILNQIPVVNENINNYISAISNVSRFYENQDYEIRSLISKNIEKIDRLEEEKKNANY